MQTTSTPSTLRSDAKIRIDDVAARELLAGLSRIHPLLVVTDLGGRVLWMSETLSVACGGAAQHLGGDLCSAFAALPGAREKARIQEQLAQMQHHLRSQDSLGDIRLDLGVRDGIARTVDLSVFRSDTASGQPIVVTILRPSEDRSAADPALVGERELLAGILEVSSDAVLALDRFGFVAYANPAAADVLECGADELVNRPLAQLVARSPQLASLLADLHRDDGAGPRRLELALSDGRTRELAVSVRPHRRGRRVRSVVFLRDVTEAAARTRALERKNAELESYVNHVSHDLRSPLVSLLGFTRLLRQDYGHRLDETGRHFADRIEQAAHTMRSLVDDLLELSRIGVAHEQRALVDPRGVLLQIQAELKLRLDEAGARLSIPDGPPLVLCDRTRLYQLFSNLIGNALQHMGECEDRTIEVEITRRADEDVITVTDHGQGIESSELPRIFDPFYGRIRSKSAGASTGIGLAIVRKIAETHGGRAWAESEPGRGARFHVSLPRRK